VCQGQSIAESNSDFAQTIKSVVRDKISEGNSKNQIYDFLISKYGEWIVYKPSFRKQNLLLWLIPYFILLLGGVVIYNTLKKSNNKNDN
jgi:cytochrome c-type biogenesis protein CcmH